MIKQLFTNQDEYFDWLRVQLETYSKSIEDFEYRKGITFGEDNGDGGEADLDNIIVTDQELLPQKYPCLLIYKYEKGFDRQGNHEIYLDEFIYIDDFNWWSRLKSLLTRTKREE